MNNLAIMAFLMMPAIGSYGWQTLVTRRNQQRYISRYPFNPRIKAKLAEKYPHLGEVDQDRIIEGLRYFLLMAAKHSPQMAMPSQAVDVAWHEFILLTHEYSAFCKKAYGGYLHHVPVTEGIYGYHQKKLKNVWLWSCQDERLHSELPARLPRLFAIDRDLNIPDGFHYSLADANYPLFMIYQSPKDLQESILRLLSEPTEIERPIAIQMLSRSIGSRLRDETYLKRYSASQLEQLLQGILVHPDLSVAVFGSSDPESIMAEYKSKIGTANDGMTGCGGGCGGCGGGC